MYLARSPYIAALGILILAASKSFVDYSTSGLENPLTNLLIVLFMLVFYSTRRNSRSIFWLSLIAALAALNRMDTLLLFAPPLIYKLYKSPTFRSIIAALLGFLPFLFWEAFSLWYYGFLFPNTAYAKLDTGIRAAQLLHQGIGYFISSAKYDPIMPNSSYAQSGLQAKYSHQKVAVVLNRIGFLVLRRVHMFILSISLH